MGEPAGGRPGQLQQDLHGHQERGGPVREVPGQGLQGRHRPVRRGPHDLPAATGQALGGFLARDKDDFVLRNLRQVYEVLFSYFFVNKCL